jgi:hypothetical protein
MHNKHAQSAAEMLVRDSTRPNTVDVRYEDMIVDCVHFCAILTDFAIEGIEIDRAVHGFWLHSLFGGVSKEENLGEQHALHITSGSFAQWKTQMPRASVNLCE